MPVTPTYPGVYIEEIPSGVRTITGVATSVAAFLDFFKRGPMNRAVQLFNFADFEREFGGLDERSEASFGIQQFFRNGGTQAWAVRAASGTLAESNVAIQSGIGGGTALTVTAINPGVWGDGLRVSIDYPQPPSGDQFNMTISLFDLQVSATVPVQTETFRGLSMGSSRADFVETVVNDEFTGSRLVRVTASGSDRPQQTGTLSGQLGPFPIALTSTAPQLTVTIGTEGTGTATFPVGTMALPSLSEARSMLESAIRSARPELRAFSQASVSIVDNRLRILAGPTQANSRVTFAGVDGDLTATQLELVPGISLRGLISDDASGAFAHGGGEVEVTIGGNAQTLTLGPMADLDAARTEIETRIRAADGSPEFTGARVIAHSEGTAQRLIVLAGVSGTSVSLGPTVGDATTVSELALDVGSATTVTALISGDLAVVPTISAGSAVRVTIGADGPRTATTTSDAPALPNIASELQAAIRASSGVPAFSGARVAAYTSGENRLVTIAGVSGDAVVFGIAGADATTVTQLQLDAANAQANVQSYQLGAGAAVPDTAQGAATPGADGDPPDGNAMIGDQNAKSGLHAFRDVDLFNILCLPRAARVNGQDAHAMDIGEAQAVISFAMDFCEELRAFFIVDPPDTINRVDQIQDHVDQNLRRHRNAAIYFPRVQIPNPLDNFRLRSVGPSGTIAGLYARIDSARGVFKAPAGTEATLSNVQQLSLKLTDPQNGVLNPLAINALRSFPVFGRVCWGARTLEGADQLASEWKYVPVRRLALFIEESLFRGTQFVVFEPNDEPLWAQIRLNVGAFMQTLFLQGAFQGTTPRQAYFVKVDSETTPQTDIDRGIVNIVVGFAPLKPAEFVIVKIQQIAGQTS